VCLGPDAELQHVKLLDSCAVTKAAHATHLTRVSRPCAAAVHCQSPTTNPPQRPRTARPARPGAQQPTRPARSSAPQRRRPWQLWPSRSRPERQLQLQAAVWWGGVGWVGGWNGDMGPLLLARRPAGCGADAPGRACLLAIEGVLTVSVCECSVTSIIIDFLLSGWSWARVS
jgi:hypothetical protein